MLGKVKGYTLIECLISLVLASFILSMIFAIVLASEKNFTLQEERLKRQEDAQAVIDILQKAIKSAGYIGCAKLKKDFPVHSSLPISFSHQTQLIGHANHAFTIKKASNAFSVLLKPVNQTKVLTTTINVRYHPGDYLFISDCLHAEIAEVSTVFYANNQQIITLKEKLASSFGVLSELSHFEVNTYFISSTKRKQANGKVLNALFVKNVHGRQLELVEGVEEMEIHYVIPYQQNWQMKSAHEITNWTLVRGVQINLLFSYADLKKKIPIYIAL